MYSSRPCIVLTVLSKEEKENLNKLKINVVYTLRETGISKEEITKNIDKIHRIGKTDKNNTKNTIIKLKSHSFKEKIYLERKAITKRDLKIKPSITNTERCQHFHNEQPTLGPTFSLYMRMYTRT